MSNRIELAQAAGLVKCPKCYGYGDRFPQGFWEDLKAAFGNGLRCELCKGAGFIPTRRSKESNETEIDWGEYVRRGKNADR